MEKVSMKTVDIGLQTTGKAKPGNQTGDVSGDYDFRKMLQSKNEDAQGKQDSKEVSKDQDQDTAADKTDKTGDKKQDGVSKEEGKTDRTDSSETDTRQVEVMIAAQIRERFSCGFAAAEQETGEQTGSVITEAMGVSDGMSETGENISHMMGVEEQTAVQTQTGEEKQVEMPEVGRVQPMQPEKSAVQPEHVQKPEDANAAEAVSVIRNQNTSETKQQTQDFSSNLKENVRTVQPEEKADMQPESFAAEQAAAAAARPQTDQVTRKEPEKPEMPVRLHVEQPEELPEKVTDTLLAKLTEGVKEFEIHIEPVNLGKIAVKVLYEGNQATISIVCSEKRAMEALSQNVREIGNIIDRNLGGETTIIVDKQETDYLNQTRDENQQEDQNGKQQKEEKNQNQDGEDAEQFLQKLRLGLA